MDQKCSELTTQKTSFLIKVTPDFIFPCRSGKKHLALVKIS
jgi:hypothetical protein